LGHFDALQSSKIERNWQNNCETLFGTTKGNVDADAVCTCMHAQLNMSFLNVFHLKEAIQNKELVSLQ